MRSRNRDRESLSICSYDRISQLVFGCSQGREPFHLLPRDRQLYHITKIVYSEYVSLKGEGIFAYFSKYSGWYFQDFCLGGGGGQRETENSVEREQTVFF